MNLYVLAFLTNKDQVLLLRRCGVTFANGQYSLVGGKVEQGETALQAIKREVAEEVGLDLDESKFTFVHAFHRKGSESELVALCFSADITGLIPKNNEPIKCDDVKFFKYFEMPENLIPAHAQAIKCILNSEYYSEHGW